MVAAEVKNERKEGRQCHIRAVGPVLTQTRAPHADAGKPYGSQRLAKLGDADGQRSKQAARWSEHHIARSGLRSARERWLEGGCSRARSDRRRITGRAMCVGDGVAFSEVWMTASSCTDAAFFEKTLELLALLHHACAHTLSLSLHQLFSVARILL